MRFLNRLNRGLIIGACIVLLVIVALVARGHMHKITINTDTTPVKLELNERGYTINSASKTFALPADSYAYKATAKVDGKDISIINRVDLTQYKLVTLNL